MLILLNNNELCDIIKVYVSLEFKSGGLCTLQVDQDVHIKTTSYQHKHVFYHASMSLW